MTVLPPYVLRVDGVTRTVAAAEQADSLSTVLRDGLSVHEVPVACGTGSCGSCVVLLDGLLVTSCTVLAADAQDSDVRTVRSLGTAEKPGREQQALIDAGAVQCGFCTPGMSLAAHDLLARHASPDETAVRCALAGQLCRCTGYGRIVAAVLSLADAPPAGSA